MALTVILLVGTLLMILTGVAVWHVVQLLSRPPVRNDLRRHIRPAAPPSDARRTPSTTRALRVPSAGVPRFR